MPFLPGVPKVEIHVVASRPAERDGFLTMKRFELVVVQTDGERTTKSSPFPYDLVERRALDAAVMAAHYVAPDGKTHVYLRTSIRPPILLSGPNATGTDEPSQGVLWELPAGLIEPGEEPPSAAARELEEELGFAVAPSRMQPLGSSIYPAPALIAERQWFFHVTVDPDARSVPDGDGSPLEDAAEIIAVPLEVALQACRVGEIRDAKTELGLLRLHALLSTDASAMTAGAGVTAGSP